jgi:hypothetical protein
MAKDEDLLTRSRYRHTKYPTGFDERRFLPVLVEDLASILPFRNDHVVELLAFRLVEVHQNTSSGREIGTQEPFTL